MLFRSDDSSDILGRPHLHWPQSRFGGLADSSPFNGFITYPFLTAASWVVASLVSGCALGFVVIAAIRFMKAKPSA